MKLRLTKGPLFNERHATRVLTVVHAARSEDRVPPGSHKKGIEWLHGIRFVHSHPPRFGPADADMQCSAFSAFRSGQSAQIQSGPE